MVLGILLYTILGLARAQTLEKGDEIEQSSNEMRSKESAIVGNPKWHTAYDYGIVCCSITCQHFSLSINE